MDPVELDRPGTERFIGRSALGLVTIAIGAGVFAVLVVLVQTRSQVLLGLDREVAATLNDLVSTRPFLVTVLSGLSELGGSPASWLILSTVAVVLLVRRLPRLAVYVAVTGLGAAVLSPAVKELVGRLRPIVEIPVASAPGPSFPSGHALGSTVTYGVLLLVFLPAVPQRARRPVIAATVALVAAIGVTRLALGVHFLSDVVAGWLLGLGWLAVTAAAFRTWRRTDGVRTPAPSSGLAPEVAPALAPAPDAREPVLPHPWRRAAELLVVWVLVLGVLLTAGWLITEVVTTTVDRLDSAVVQWLADHRTPALTAVSAVVNPLGGTAVVLVVLLVATAVTLAVTRQWRPVLFLVATMVGEVTLFLAVASVISRPRPDVSHLGPPLPPTSSFPSGHVAAALSLYGAIAVLVLVFSSSQWRWLVVAAAVVLVTVVALGRLYRGVHHPTDVLGSLVLALPWLLTTRRVLLPGVNAAEGSRQ